MCLRLSVCMPVCPGRFGMVMSVECRVSHMPRLGVFLCQWCASSGRVLFWQWRARAPGAVASHIYDHPHIMCLALACPAFLYGHSGTGAARLKTSSMSGGEACMLWPHPTPWYVFFLCCSTPSCYVRGCSAAHLLAVHREDTCMHRQTEREAESVRTKYC